MAPRGQKWGENEWMRLLDLYENHQLLWDPSHAEYKNKKLRESALQSITNILKLPGISAADVKRKLKAMRSTYNQELSKIARSKVASTEIFKPQLVWFQRADTFLRNIARSRSKCWMIEEENKGHSRNSVDELVEVIIRDQPETVDVHDDSSVEIQTAFQPNPQPEPSPARPYRLSVTPFTQITKERKRNSCPPTQNHLPPKKQASEPILDPKVLKLCQVVADDLSDTYGKFGSLVASQLRSLPTAEALRLQREIQQLITDRLIANCNRNCGHVSQNCQCK